MHTPDFPKRIELELVSSCNLKCIYCPRQYVNDLNGFMDISLFTRLIDEIFSYPETILVLHRRGESLLHPDFLSLMKYIKGKFNTVQLATNATLLDHEKSMAIIKSVTFLSFSIDTPGRYNITRRPGNYAKVENNILHFLEANNNNGNPVTTQVSMVKTADTSNDDIHQFKAIWKDKVDRVRIYEEHSKDGKFGSLENKRNGRKPCVMPFYEMLIYSDGQVGRCNHDWDGPPIESIRNKSIQNIWNSSFLQDLRKQHQDLNITDEVCACCDSWYPEIGKQGTGLVIEK